MIVSAEDYITAMEKENLFSPSHDIPECNSQTWCKYYQLLRSITGFERTEEIHVTKGGLGFAVGTLDTESTTKRWALLEPISHPFIPFTTERLFQTIEADADELQEILGSDEAIQTETFRLPKVGNALPNNFIYLNSPVAMFRENFQNYIEGLESGRRKQARRLMRDFDDNPAFRFELSSDPLHSDEMDFLVKMTHKRWGEDGWQYACAQTLWVQAAITVNPAAARFMRVYEGEDLILIAGYIVRENTITSQSTCRNEDRLHSGLGTMVDFKTIQIMHGQSEIKMLDPTCRTGLDDPENIGVAKREVVNTDVLRPLLRITSNKDDQYPSFACDSGWNPLAEKIILGRAA